MYKKIVSAVLAAATAVTFSASAFAASTTADPSHKEMDVGTLVSTPAINITWPTTAGVVLNPYKTKIKVTLAAGKAPSVADDTATTNKGDTVISPELVFSNKGNSEVQISVTGSVNAYTTVDKAGAPLLDKDGNPTNSLATGDQVAWNPTGGTDKSGAPITGLTSKITIATAAIKQPTWSGVGDSAKLTAGETKNSVLLYVEAGTPDATGKVFTYADSFDTKNTRQMLLGTKDVTKALFTIAAKTGVQNAQVRGDVATAPTIGWDKVAKTDGISVKLVFDASPIAPLPPKPTEATTP